MKEAQKVLGKNLKKLREEKKISQEEFAKIFNISQRTYSHYENGERAMNIELLIEIANYYNISLDIITGRYKIN